MIETAPASGTSSLPSSSSSAVVASRPAKTPKLIRISRPAGAWSTSKAMMFSTCITSRMYRPGPKLTLSRLPAEIPHGHHDSECPPGGQDGDRRRLVPELLPMQVDRVDGVDEVLQWQDVSDCAQILRVVGGRPERAGEEGHPQADDVDQPPRSLDRAGQRCETK